MALTKLTFKNKGEVADEKPKETLAEKTKGFKFKLPEPKTESNLQSKKPFQTGDASNARPAEQSTNKLSETIANKSKTETEGKLEKASNSIPEMSDDKYEVVANASDEFSEEAGDKFQQQLGILQSAIDGVGDLKDGMQNVLLFLDDNPQYKDNISPKDVSIFVAACRKVANITVTEKKTRKAKVKKNDELEGDIMADLANLDLDLGV